MPVIMENQEGTVGASGGRLPGTQRPGDPSTLHEISERDIHQKSCKPYAKPLPYPFTRLQRSAHDATANAPSENSPFESFPQGPIQHPQGSGGWPFNTQNHYGGANSSGNAPPGAFNLSELRGALPESQLSRSRISSHDPQLLLSGPPRFGSHQIPPFAGQAMTASAPYNYYSPQFSTPYQQTPPTGPQYPQPQPGPQPHSGGVGQQHLPNQAPVYVYYPGQYGQATGPHQGFQSPPGPYSAVYNRNAGVPYMTGFFPQQEADPNIMSGKAQIYGKHLTSSSNSGFNSPEIYLRSGSGPGKQMHNSSYRSPTDFQISIAASRVSSHSSLGTIPSSPRGPPRKPKQSGHALWIGNLPSGALVSDLKDHFSRGFKDTIESAFLISKSNCAFVNYRTEAACAAAMEKFHESRFQNVRLVCRLRRSSAPPSSGIPTGPAALAPPSAQSQTAFEAITQNREISSRAEEQALAGHSQKSTATPKVNNKYFVLKSLTVEDMELSVRNGIWATQAHNEDALNKAFEVSRPGESP